MILIEISKGEFLLSFWIDDFLKFREKFLEDLDNIMLISMVTKEQVKVDLLDIFVSLNRGLNISDITFQVNNLYSPRGEKAEHEMIMEVLDELTEKEFLKKFQVGSLDSWKITEDGEDHFYSL